MPVSSLVTDYLGINNVYLSLPAVINRSGVREVMKLELSPEEKPAFTASAEAIKKAIKETGLI